MNSLEEDIERINREEMLEDGGLRGLSLQQSIDLLDNMGILNAPIDYGQPRNEETLHGYLHGPLRYIGDYGIGLDETVGRAVLNIPGSILSAIGTASEGIFGGESTIKKWGTNLLDWDARFKNAAEDTFSAVAGTDPGYWDRVTRGAGTSTGFYLTGLGAQGLAGAAGVVSPLLRTAIGYGARNLMESATEAGSMVSDTYAQDKTRLGDALKAGAWSFGTNAPLDTLQGGFEGWLEKKLDDVIPLGGTFAKELGREYLRGLIKEETNELLQESRQQAIETALSNAYASGDMSLLNVLKNLGRETLNLPQHFKDVAGETAGSTLISHSLMWPLDLEFSGKGNAYKGYYDLKGQRDSLRSEIEQMRNSVGQSDASTQAEINDKEQRANLLDLILSNYWEGNEEGQEKINQQRQVMAYDALQRQRDNLRAEAESIDAGDEADSSLGSIQDILAKVSSYTNQLNNFWGDTGVVTNPVQDDDMDLFPDRDELNAPQAEPTPSTPSTPERPAPIQPVPPLLRNLAPDEQQITIPDEALMSPSAVSTEDLQSSLPPLTSLKAEPKPQPQSTQQNAITGNTARVRTMRGTEADIRYRVVDADDLIVSTKDTGAPNPNYPQELQPRQRNREASFAQINRMAHNLDPELLGENRLASDGAPVIGSDMVVESGNGRVMAIRQAYKVGKAENYRAWIKDNAERFGLDAGHVDGMNAPVLVRERISDVDRVKFTSEANESSTAQMSATEHALDDAKKVTPEILTYYDPDKSLAANQTFIMAFRGLIPQNERGDFMQSNGKVSKAGLERVQNALLAKAYNDTDLLNRLNELYDDEIKNVSNALISAAPKMAVFENGSFNPEISIRDDIVKAVHTLAHLKQEGRTVDEFLAQISMFDDVSDETKRLLQFFDKNKRSSRRIAQGLIHYADSAMNEARQGQALMFEDSARTKGQILDEALRYGENSEPESYNQSSGDGVIGSLNVDTDGQNRKFSVEVGEFTDKYPEHKKYFGRYFNIKDETGRIVARYAPYTKKLQMAEGSEALRGQIEHNVRSNLRKMLEKAGFLDERGKLKSDSNEEFRHQYRTRADTTLEGRKVHPNNLRGSETERKDRRSFWRKAKDTITETAAEHHVRLGIQKNLQEELRKVLEAQYGHSKGIATKIENYTKFASKLYSSLITARLANAAHVAGMRINELYKLWNLRFQFDEVLQTGKEGNRAFITFNPAQYNNDGTMKSAPSTVIHLTEFTDESSPLHELTHAFLRDFQDLMATVHDLPVQVTQDWINLIKWLGVSDIDLTKSVSEMSEDERRRWTNAQEKFAVTGEQYYMTGKAPSSWLKRAFDSFKRWLTRIYHAVRNVKYMGPDGQMHETELSPEIQGIYDRLFKSGVPFVPNSANTEARRARAGLRGQTEEHYQPRNDSQENGEYPLGRQKSIRDVLNIMQTEQGVRNSGQIWVDYARVSPEEAKRISEATGLDITDRYVHTLVGSAITHVENRHGVGNEQRQDQLPITEADIERIPEIIRTADEIRLGTDKTSGNLNDTIVYQKRINGHVLIVEEVRKGRKKLAFHTMRKAKAGYVYDLSLKGQPIVKERAMSEGLNVRNAQTPEVQYPNAHSSADSLTGSNQAVNGTDRIRRTNDTLISPEEIERYNQDGLHATGHIIRGNKFGLEFIGSGEGNQSYGYGIYFAESPEVAETYRRMGLSENDLIAGVIIRTKDGKTYSADETDYAANEAIHGIRSDLRAFVKPGETADIEHIKSLLSQEYSDKLKELQNAITRNKKRLADASQSTMWAAKRSMQVLKQEIQRDRKSIKSIRDKFKALDNIAEISRGTVKHGNIYKADIPENNTLLDWDAPISDQPEKVRKAMDKVLAKLSKWGINPYENHILAKPETGEDFYHDLTQALTKFVAQERMRSKKHGLITRPDMAASLMLNQAGIPGLRYFDGQSRKEQEGTHNFVIWNTDLVKILGLTEDSDQDAIDYFNETRAKQNSGADSYNQTAINNEAQAWSNAVDKVLSGEIRIDEHIKVMNTPEVFSLIGAKSLPVYMDAGKIRSVLDKHPAITPYIIKQIPTAVTDPIAIFSSATHPNDSIIVMTEITDKDGGTVIVPVQLDVQQHNYKINRIASVFAKKNDKTGQVHNEWFVKQVQDGRLLYINNKKSSQWSIQTGLQLSVGSPLENLAQSIPNENDLAKLHQTAQERIYRDMSHFFGHSKTFLTPALLEQYEQPAWHGTGHILEGNRFMLSKIGAGQGHQSYGYGIYLAQNKDVADTYRRYGLPKGGITHIHTIDGKVFSPENGLFRSKPDDYFSQVLHDVQEKAAALNSTQHSKIIQDVRDDYSNNINWEKTLARRDKSYKGIAKKYIDVLSQKLELLNRIAKIDFSDTGNGNIYSVDAPENNVLLDYDATLAEQPEKVQKAIDKIKLKLLKWGIDLAAEIKKNDDVFLPTTGGDFYFALAKAVNTLLTSHRLTSKTFGKITQGDMGASYMFNQFGIPGLRYLDGWSREDGNGTHNFVIWNTDTLKVLGVEGDKKAVDYFKAHKTAETESYNQSGITRENNNILQRFRDIQEKANPESITLDNLADGNNGFMSDDEVERYNQPSWQGTGHIIEDNKIDLSKIGTGEGHQAFGYGVYTAQLKDVAQTYRHYGIPNSGMGTIHISTNDGTVYSAKDKDAWDNSPDRSQAVALNALLWSAIRSAKSGVRDDFSGVKQRAATYLDAMRKSGKIDGKYVYGINPLIYNALDFLDTVQDFSFSPDENSTRKGNLYLWDVPENDVLLDWDASLDEQTEHVKKAIKKIKYFLRKKLPYTGVDTDYLQALDGTETGEDFYWALTDLMEQYIEWKTPQDGINRPDQRASLLLNKFGIPGHRYWDGESRDNGEGTHNFVTWNKDAIKLLGIDPDSDNDAIEYFNRYKAEHPDGFISTDFIEHYEQLKGHATGNIIFNNHFDLQYKGSSEGGAAYGHGAYFFEAPEVGEHYRRYGLKNGGFGNIHISTNDGQSFNSDGYHNWGDILNRDISDVLTALEDAVDDVRTTGKAPDTERIRQNLAKSYRQDLRFLQEKLTQGLAELHNLDNGSDVYSSLSHDLQTVREIIQSFKDKIAFIKSISSLSIDENKNGNVYTFDIPEDEDLLDWDAPLAEQSDKIMPAVREAIDTINNHPERLLAFGFSQFTDNPKNTETALLHIIKSLYSKFNGHTVNWWNDENTGKLPAETTQLQNLFPDEIVFSNLRLAVNSLTLHHTNIDKNSSTGGDLYWSLTELLGSDENASLWLNQHGISGHRFWDAKSREEKQGTHNYVIWDMDKISMVAISDDSDTDAKEYFYRTKAEQEADNNNFITDELIEHYEQLAYHGTRHIINGNRLNLDFLGTGEGNQSYGFGIYLAQKKGVAQVYRTAGLSEKEQAKAIITADDGNEYADLDFFSYLQDKVKGLGVSDKDTINVIAGDFSNHIVDFTNGDYLSINDAVQAYITETTHLAGKEYSNVIKKVAELYTPKDAKPANNRKGNLYSVDVPEDFDLLNWDAPMSEQSPKVLNALKLAGLYLNDNETGEELYRRLEREADNWLENDKYASMKLNDAGIPGHYYFDGISRNKGEGTHNFVIWNTDTLQLLGISDDSDNNAQEYFRLQDYYNSYLDSLDNNSDISEYGRDNENSRIDTLYSNTMDALDIQPEHYNQIIGIAGAKKLDEADSSTTRMDNLKIARQMEHQGKPAKRLWLATGWMRGVDGKWRYEIPDGKLNGRKARNLFRLAQEFETLSNNKTLSPSDKERYSFLEKAVNANLPDVFDAPQLFRAYPELRNIGFSFIPADGDFIAAYEPNDGTIYFDMDTFNNMPPIYSKNPAVMRNLVLIHEIQHAIQDIEGFAKGGDNSSIKANKRTGMVNANPFIRRNLLRQANIILDSLTPQQRSTFRTLSKYEDTIDNDDFNTLIHDSLSPEELRLYLQWRKLRDERKNVANSRVNFDEFESYENIAGEVEARNSMKRATWSEKHRRATPLDASEEKQYPRNSQFVIDNQGNPYFRNSFISPELIEHYDQLVYHATDNIIRGNKFNLKYVGSSEGSSLIAYGAYFAANPDVATTYRHFGDPNRGEAGITVTMKTGEMFAYKGNYAWSGKPDNITRKILIDLASIVRRSGNYDLKSIRKELAKIYRQDIKAHQYMLNDYFERVAEDGITPDNATLPPLMQEKHDTILNLRKQIKALGNISSVDVSAPRNGNMYSFDIDDNEMPYLLDWDKSMSRQSEFIRGVKKEIIREFKYWGLDTEILRKAKTGEEFYRAIQYTMRDAGEGFAYPQKGITDPQQRASLILNMHGIPGLQYWDNFSREKKRGTHNYVIWNMDTINMLGISDNSNPDAIEHFNRTNAEQNNNGKETFYQPAINSKDDIEKLISDAPTVIQMIINDYYLKGDFKTADTLANDMLNIPTLEKYHSIINSIEKSKLNPLAVNAVNSDNSQQKISIAKEQLETLRKKYQNTDLWLKAPNGKKSNLPELQWLQVRTDSFKHWFGDWELNPEQASKVVDDNGEPLIVWHGSKSAGFSIFNKKGEYGSINSGVFFTTKKDNALFYAKNRNEQNLYPVFLNIRNPYIYNAHGKSGAALADIYIKDNYDGSTIDTDNNGQLLYYDDALRYIQNVLHDTEIKRYSIHSEGFQNTDDVVRAVWRGSLGNGNHDGVIFRDIRDPYEHMDEFITRTPENIKSATNNNGGFDPDNPDIYYQSQIHSQQFKAWFGDWENDPDNSSKVVDENGRPLIVYHGTATQDIRIFSHRKAQDKSGRSWHLGQGKGKFYLATTLLGAEAAASGAVARGNGTSPVIMPLFVNIRNPISLHNYEKLFRSLSGHTLYDDYDNSYSMNDRDKFIAALDKKLKKQGVDGLFDLDAGLAAPFYPEQIKSATSNNGDFNPDNPDIYYQSNPYVQHYDTFDDPDTEAAFSEKSTGNDTDGTLTRIAQAAHDFIHGLRGDFPELATPQAKNKGLTFAREALRRMNRQTDAKAQQAVQTLHNSLKNLNPRQFNIFARLLLINDLYTFKRYNPDAALPLNFTQQSLKTEREKFSALAQRDKSIMAAVQAEHSAHSAIQKQLAALADKLGMTKFAEKVKRYDFYMLDYARLLGGNNINANYIQAVGETRNEYLQDIERLNTLLELKSHYDKKAELVKQFGDAWQRHIPDGYTIFNPLAGRFIHSAHTLTENILDMAIEQAGEHMNLSEKTINDFRNKLSDNSDNHLLVLPEELADTLSSLSRPVHRSPLGKIAKTITTGWKKYILYFPTRAFKYNIRNMTGDLDAVIAGNPHALTYMGQAMSKLWDLYYGDKDNISPELQEFQKRGGAITIQTTQELGDYKQLKEFQNLVDDLQDKGLPAWKKLPKKTWALIDKFAWSGIQNFSDFREQWLRYATYLDYLQQMQNNNGIPDNWGASVKDEVMSLQNLRDRAFKMSNELLGAYDQVSDTGKQLRDIAIPFYSWLEVNAKRYYQLIKNGISEDNAGDFASRFLKGELANVPYYAFKLGKTYLMINLLAMLISAFNHIVWPDDEDKLPPDIQGRPHITLGHDTDGNVLYFDRVGAMLDNLEWFGQDNSPFAPFAGDIKDIFDGKQSFSGFVSKTASAPINKVVNALNPFVKMPAELLTGKSLYPEATNPGNIRDRKKYIAQSLGLSWPYKIATGEPRSDWKEFKNIFLYSADADEAAYFYSLSKVREFRDKVLRKRFDGFAYTQRGDTLRKLKTALRLDDKDAVRQYLKEYYRLNGSRQGLKTSMRNLNPLHGLSRQEQAQFLRWISPDDRKYLNRANSYFHKLADKFLR